MRMKSMVTVGFLSVTAATTSFASGANRVGVIENIGSGGPEYPYSRPMSH